MIYKKYFKQFVKDLDKKMLKGFKEYGDGSFSRDPRELMGELQQEAIDLAGWGMILWVRLNELKKEYERKR